MAPLATLGKFIATARKAKFLTQVELAAACKYEYNIVSKWENGQSKPSASDWNKLTHLLAPFLDIEATKPLLVKGLASIQPEERNPSPRIDPDVCRRLRRLREETGLAALQVAQELGLAPSQVSRMESGLTNPTYTQLYKLVRLYKTTYEYVLEGKRGGQ